MEQNGEMPGKASNYIGHFKRLLQNRQTIKVVLYCRVSRCQQYKNGNLSDQLKYLRRKIGKFSKKYNVKIEVVTYFKETASGWCNDRERLIWAAKTAKACNAVLLAESTCRFLRHAGYHSSRRPDILPTVDDFKTLLSNTKHVQLATMMHPDTPWRKVKSYHVKRGQQTKQRQGGRPVGQYPGYKKEQRKQNLNRVLKLHTKGETVAAIVRVTGIARSTINDWIRKSNGF